MSQPAHQYRAYFGLLYAPAIVSLLKFTRESVSTILQGFLPELILDPSCLRTRDYSVTRQVESTSVGSGAEPRLSQSELFACSPEALCILYANCMSSDVRVLFPYCPCCLGYGFSGEEKMLSRSSMPYSSRAFCGSDSPSPCTFVSSCIMCSHTWALTLQRRRVYTCRSRLFRPAFYALLEQL